MQLCTPINRHPGQLRAGLQLVLVSVRKEWRLYVRYPVDTLMLTIRPLLMFLPFYLMSAFLLESADQTATFGAYGFAWYSLVSILFWTALQNVVIAASSFIYSEVVQGTLESLLVTPTSQPSIISANAVFAMGQQSVLLVVGFGAMAALAKPAPGLVTWLITVAVALAGLTLAYGFGLLLGGLTIVTKRMDYSYMAVSLLAFLAGQSYSPAVYPLPLRVMAYANPLTYPMDLLRHVLLGTEPLLAPEAEVLVLVIGTGASIMAGLWVLNRAVRKLRATGRAGAF